MFVNYYKKYNLDRTLGTSTIREELESICSDIIRKLNNAGGNLEREYNIRKELETVEDALVVFASEVSRESYDQELRNNVKESMLANSDEEILEILEDPEKIESMDSKKLEVLLEKIAAKQLETIQKKEEKIQYSTTRSENVNIAKANNLVNLIGMEIKSELKGFIWQGTNSNLSNYIEEALKLDSSNYLAWHYKFIYLLLFQGNQFKIPWDFTTLTQEQLGKLTAKERNILEHQMLMDKGYVSNYDITNAIDAWQKSPIKFNRKRKNEMKEGFSEENISSREVLMKEVLDQAKSSKTESTLTNLQDKLMKIKMGQSYSYIEKCRMMLESGNRYRELEILYNRAIELAPLEKKKEIEKNMNDSIENIYGYLMEKGHKTKKEITEHYVEKRYEEAVNSEKHIMYTMKNIRKRVKNVNNKVIDIICYILLIVMALSMISLFIPENILVTQSIKQVIKIAAIAAIIQSIIHLLRGTAKYGKIATSITGIPFLSAQVIILVTGTKYMEQLSISAFRGTIVASFIIFSLMGLGNEMISPESTPELIIDIIWNYIFSCLRWTLVGAGGIYAFGLVASIFTSDYNSEVILSISKGIINLVPLQIPTLSIFVSTIFNKGKVQGCGINFGIYNYITIKESDAALFPNNKIFEVESDSK